MWIVWYTLQVQKWYVYYLIKICCKSSRYLSYSGEIHQFAAHTRSVRCMKPIIFALFCHRNAHFYPLYKVDIPFIRQNIQTIATINIYLTDNRGGWKTPSEFLYIGCSGTITHSDMIPSFLQLILAFSIICSYLTKNSNTNKINNFYIYFRIRK